MTARRKWLAGGLALAALGAVWLGAGRSHRPAAPTEPAEPAEVAQLARRDYPRLADMPRLAHADADAGAVATTSRAGAPVQPPPPAQVINVGGAGPAPSPQPASAWAIDYRDAVCACHTRQCVGDLQGGFVRKLSAVVHGDEADDATYAAATSAAIRCYYALPEGS
jgi:hypothetical protein